MRCYFNIFLTFNVWIQVSPWRYVHIKNICFLFLWRKWEYPYFILWSTMIFSSRNGSKNLTRVSIFEPNLSSPKSFFKAIFQCHFVHCWWWLHLNRSLFLSFIEFLLHFGKINVSKPTQPLNLMNQNPLSIKKMR